jgi:hypothetical protein
MPGFNRNFDILDETGNKKLNFIDDNVSVFNFEGQVSRISHLTQVLSNIGVDSRLSNTAHREDKDVFQLWLNKNYIFKIIFKLNLSFYFMFICIDVHFNFSEFFI